MNEFGEIVNIFDLSEEEINEHMTCMLEWQTPEELLEELVECGLELTPEEKKHWVDLIVIDTEEQAENFISALEKAERI